MPGIATVLYNDILRPRKRMILYVFLIVVFSLATYFAIQTLVKPRMAFYENFGSDISNDNSREQQATIMAFFAGWCPHCKSAQPEWQSFSSDISSKPYGSYLLKSKEVDCTDGTDPLIQKYSINGYPSVIILKDGQTVRFEGKVTKENLEQFVTGTLGPKKA